MKKRTDLRFWSIIFLIGISAGISWSLFFKNYIQEDKIKIANFPMQIEGWSAEDLPLSQLEYDILETRNVFVRKYSKDDEQDIYLFIVYSENNRKVSHPPEVCYTGAGVSVLSNTRDAIPAIPGKKEIAVNKLLLDQQGKKQTAFYWFKVGDTFTSNYWKQQILIASKTLLRKPSSSALIRISTNIVNKNEVKAAQDLRIFGNLITSHLYQYLP